MESGLNVAVVGLGGAVATTAAAGIELLRSGSNDLAGLPLAEHDVAGLPPYRKLSFAGWDLFPDDLATAAAQHGVLGRDQLEAAAPGLRAVRPWAAVGSTDFCRGVDGANKLVTGSHRAAVEAIRSDLAKLNGRTVMLNLASTERPADLGSDALQTRDGFERGLDANDPAISPAMLYAYAAIEHGVPYGNFTPSVAADAPALAALAKARGVPVAGKDGKTGQTFMKTVIAPALRARALYVEGWFSTNILGNRDGLALNDPDSLKSKLDTKGSVLDDMLGYAVEDHIVDIRYYRPRGDDKEAWDNIDVAGFLGQRMQLKLNFLCKDSILAAPLAIEIARCLALAAKRGDGGVQEQLGVFFKAPQTKGGRRPEHAFQRQHDALLRWLYQ
ncbi:MAG: inositol-3-phosphate synthase [Sphingomonadaceae bacterium]|nr:inositol-3-phosphate synthase [Sphingomonadaceae bacterium]